MDEEDAPYNILDEDSCMGKVVVYVDPRQYDRIVKRRLERARLMERRGRPKPVYVPIGVREVSPESSQDDDLADEIETDEELENYHQHGLMTGGNDNGYLGVPLTSNPMNANYKNGVCNMVPMSNARLVHGVYSANIHPGALPNVPLPYDDRATFSHEGVVGNKTGGWAMSRNSTRPNGYISPDYYSIYDAQVAKRGRDDFNGGNRTKRTKVAEFAPHGGLNSSPFGPVPSTPYLNGHYHGANMGMFNGHYALQHSGQYPNGYDRFALNAQFGEMAQAVSSLYNFNHQDNTNGTYIKRNPTPNLSSLSHTTSTSTGTASTDRKGARCASKRKEEVKNDYLHPNISPYTQSSIDTEIVAKTEEIYNINHQGIVMDMSPKKTVRVGVGARIKRGIADVVERRMVYNIQEVRSAANCGFPLLAPEVLCEAERQGAYSIDRATNGSCDTTKGAKAEGNDVGAYLTGEAGGDEKFESNALKTDNESFGGGSDIYRELWSCFSEA